MSKQLLKYLLGVWESPLELTADNWITNPSTTTAVKISSIKLTTIYCTHKVIQQDISLTFSL